MGSHSQAPDLGERQSQENCFGTQGFFLVHLTPNHQVLKGREILQEPYCSATQDPESLPDPCSGTILLSCRSVLEELQRQTSLLSLTETQSRLRGKEDHAYLLVMERGAELRGGEVKGSMQADNMALGTWQLLAK